MVKRMVGTTPQIICIGKDTEPLDVLVQNLSVNNAYVDFNSNALDGIQILPNGYYSNPHLMETLYIVCDGANSEIRLTIQKSHCKGVTLCR